MGILSIAKKEFIQNIRDPIIMSITTLYPIVLIFLVGSAFSSGGYNPEALSNPTVAYIQAETNQEEVSSVLKKLQFNHVGAVVDIDYASNSINLYSNDSYRRQFAIVEAMAKTVGVTDYPTRGLQMAEIHTLEDHAIKSSQNIRLSQIASEVEGSILDYFGVAFMVLFMFYGISNPVANTMKEKKNGNFWRILASPVRPRNFILGKLLGQSAINCLQVAVVMLATVFIFNVNWGQNLLPILLLLISSVVMLVTLGTFIGLVFKSNGLALSLVHTFIVIFAFFGGGYFPIAGTGWLGEIGRYFSPAWWMIQSINDYVHSQSLDLLIQAFAINLGLTILFGGLMWFIVRRKEVLR